MAQFIWKLVWCHLLAQMPLVSFGFLPPKILGWPAVCVCGYQIRMSWLWLKDYVSRFILVHNREKLTWNWHIDCGALLILPWWIGSHDRVKTFVSLSFITDWRVVCEIDLFSDLLDSPADLVVRWQYSLHPLFLMRLRGPCSGPHPARPGPRWSPLVWTSRSGVTTQQFTSLTAFFIARFR